MVSKRGISVAEFAASQRYLASLSVMFVKIDISAVTDLSLVLIVEWICNWTEVIKDDVPWKSHVIKLREWQLKQ